MNRVMIMLGLKNIKPYGELKLQNEVDLITIDLLEGDLSYYPEFITKTKESLNPTLTKDRENSFLRVDLEKSKIREAVKLWYSLEKDEPMRCFIPGYRISFYAQEKLLKSASICWSCNNIKILDSMGSELWFTFNGSSAAANGLLNLVRLQVQKNM